MRNWFISCLSVAFVASLSTSIQAAPPLSTDKYRILLPLYIYPSAGIGPFGEWNAVAAAQEKVSVLAIVNPASGPGSSDCSSFNSDYAAGVQILRQAGVEMYGYVATNYAMTPLATVRTNMLRYRQCAAIPHIFLDEAAASHTTPSNVPYYRALNRFGKARGSQVIINPGVETRTAYVRRWQPAADVVATFEGDLISWADWIANDATPAWARTQDQRKFAALVYGVPNEASMKIVVDQAIARHFGAIYVTDDNLPNPWDTLPSYWNAFVAYLEQKNRAFP